MQNMQLSPSPVTVNGVIVNVVQEYINLVQTIQLGRNNFDREAARRIDLGWTAYEKLRHILESPIPQSLKAKAFNQCILPVMMTTKSKRGQKKPSKKNYILIQCVEITRFENNNEW